MRECAFCDREASISGEHIWSEWIAELLHPRVKTFYLTRFDSSAGKHNRWKKPRLNEKTNVVCQACNNTWMSDIESHAQKTLSWIIRDAAPVSLLSRGIASFATFAFKCAVVANHMSVALDSPFFSTRERYAFRESLKIPDGTHIWAALLNSKRRDGRKSYTGRWLVYYGQTSSSVPGDLDMNFLVFNFAAGHLAFQVVAPKWSRLHDAARYKLPELAADSSWDSATVRVWPPDGSSMIT